MSPAFRLAWLFASLLPFAAVAAEPAQEGPAGYTAIDSDEQLRRMCEETICQHDVSVRMKRSDGSVFANTYAVLPGVVQDNRLAVLAGQTLFVEAELGEEGLVNMRVVDAVTRPEATIELSFTQLDDGGMMLHVQNPFDRHIKWRMGIMPLGAESERGRLLKTSSCPMRAKMGIYEMWPEPIFQVVLADPRYVADDAMVCD